MRKGDKLPSERRRYPIGMDPRAEQRRERAAARKKLYDELTLEERIAKAEARPGRSESELRRLEIQREKDE